MCAASDLCVPSVSKSESIGEATMNPEDALRLILEEMSKLLQCSPLEEPTSLPC